MSMNTPVANQCPERHQKNVPPAVPRMIDVRALLGEDQLVMIEHGECRYVLRMTRNNKLILTK
ncbi:MAG: hemin uptake protein HemP [Sphingobacteriia bacterium]|nr:hemin uptake protein HemP [Sphingobacteriia bacterium]NCC38810.1 hemin uptake protein HemP [Gammaproteobacteria bacterium]